MVNLFKTSLKITLITALVINSTGQGYALRPMASVNNKLFSKTVSGELNHSDVGLKAIEQYLALIEKGLEPEKIKEEMVKLLKPFFLMSATEDFQTFLEKTRASLESHLRSLDIPEDSKIPTIMMQAFKGISTLLKDVNIWKNDTFLEDFHNSHLFVNTDEIGLKEGETITLAEMLRRFSKKFPEKLKDPDSVLIIVPEENPRFIFKNEFNEKSFHPVKSKEFYWILYQYPRLEVETQTMVPKDIFVMLGDLTTQEIDSLHNELEKLGHELWVNEKNPAPIIQSWLNKSNNRKFSKLELAKRLLLYFHKAFDDIPRGSFHREDGLEAFVAVMKELINDEKVESWMAQVIKNIYISGEHIKGRSRYYDEYTKECNFILSLLLDKGRKDIFPIAIHILMQSFIHTRGYDRSDLPMFVQSMLSIDHPDTKKALLLKSLGSSNEYRLPFMPSYKRKDEYSDIMCFLFDNILRYIVYILPFENLEMMHMSGRGRDLIANIAMAIGNLGENALHHMLDLIMQEENPVVRDKMFFFLGESEVHHNAEYYQNISHRWIDTTICLATQHKTLLRSYRTVSMVEKYPDYRKADMQKALLPLLEDPTRDDISHILWILKIYKTKQAQDAIIRHYLKKDSPYFDEALWYLIRMKDPIYFDKVWNFISDLGSSSKAIEKEDIINIGNYCVAMLSANGGAILNNGQRQKIAGFAERCILTKNPEDFSDDEMEVAQFGMVWISLAGLLKREDKLKQIQEFIDDSTNRSYWIEEILSALSLLPSDKSFNILGSFSTALLGSDKEKQKPLYKFLDSPLTDANKAQKRRLFMSLIDAAIKNELKNEFKALFDIFIFNDPEGALRVLGSEAWPKVDISGVRFSKEVKIDKDDTSGPTRTVYLSNELKKYFMQCFLASFKQPDKIQKLALLDNKKDFLERARYHIRTLLLQEAGLKEEDIERKQKEFHPIQFLFPQLAWHGSQKEDEELSSLYILKPLKDMVDLKLKISDANTDTTINYFYQMLEAHDLIFYKPLEKELKTYIDWLIKNGILQNEGLWVLDRFGAHFLKGKADYYLEPRICDFDIAAKKIDEFGEFLRNNMLSFFYPEGLKDKDERGFRETFLRTLGSLLAKNVEKRRKDGVDAEPVWPMLPAPGSTKASSAGKDIASEDKLQPIDSAILAAFASAA